MRKRLNTLDVLITSYIKTKDEALLQKIISESRKIISGWLCRYSRMKSGSGFDDFVENVALEFVSKVMHGGIVDNPVSNILMIARASFVTSNQELDYEAVSDLDGYLERSEIADLINTILLTLEPSTKQAFLYLITFPEGVDKIKKIMGATLPFYSTVLHAQRVRDCISKYKNQANQINSPKSITGTVVLLQALYQFNPALFSLFVLFKDLDKFLQFCRIFAEETIRLPSFKDLKSIFNSVSKISTDLETGDFTPQDHKFLQDLAKEDPQTVNGSDLEPVLQSFCTKSISSINDKYDKINQKIFEKMNINDQSSINYVLSVMNKERDFQQRLVLEMASAINNIAPERSEK